MNLNSTAADVRGSCLHFAALNPHALVLRYECSNAALIEICYNNFNFEWHLDHETSRGSDMRETAVMKTVLLVDDELDNLRSLGEILHRFGYAVITKSDAASALAVVRDGVLVDLIITDYRMPGVDGLEFLIQLKQILPDVPVIMLTAYGAVETYLKSLSLGVFEYVNKPVKAKELGRIVKAALESASKHAAGEDGTGISPVS